MTVFTFQRYVRHYFILVFPAFCAKYAVDIRDIWLSAKGKFFSYKLRALLILSSNKRSLVVALV